MSGLGSGGLEALTLGLGLNLAFEPSPQSFRAPTYVVGVLACDAPASLPEPSPDPTLLGSPASSLSAFNFGFPSTLALLPLVSFDTEDK